MDSETTLVDVTPPTPYFMSSSDLTNTVIYAQPGEPLYRVTSDARHVKICNGPALDQVIAVLHRRDLFSDTISFPQRHGNSRGNGSQMSLHRWLRRSKTSDGRPMFTLDTEYGPYVWRGISKHRHKVFAIYDLDTPVASCYLNQPLPDGQPAFVIESAGAPLRDDIVTAYVVQRHRLRAECKALDLFVGPT